MNEIDEKALQRWGSALSDSQRDAAWVVHHRQRDAERRLILSEMAPFVREFVGGAFGVDTLRQTFDQKTRTSWNRFGFKGLSGAMFLNQLVKHLPNQDDLTTRLRRAIDKPADEATARKTMSDFYGYLLSLVESGVVKKRLAPSRTPFLISGFWHVQEQEPWPVFYHSAQKSLGAHGLYRKTDNPVENYFTFRSVFQSLADKLGLDVWAMEHLCAWQAGQRAGDEDGSKSTDPEPARERVWLIAPGRGADHWDQFYREGIIGIGWGYLGDLSKYPSAEAIKERMRQERDDDAEPIHDALACYEFANVMAIGDEVYAKKGRNHIVGYGVVESEYQYDAKRRYPNLRRVKWIKKGDWRPRDKPLVTKTVTEIGKYPRLVQQIVDALENKRPKAVLPPVGREEIEKDLFIDGDEIDRILELIRYRKNVVLQGPPGVGKTFVASRIAYLLLGSWDTSRLLKVQFHQSYAYEDFVQGYRPTESGFVRKDGPFMRFCDRALQDQSTEYVLLIDEINRGNLSKIFGELLMLIEADKRSEQWGTELTYSDDTESPFYVPPNLYIIGTMNTADRSLALVDYALRRRFAFVDLEPMFGSEKLVAGLKRSGVGQELLDRIITRLSELNESIRADRSLGSGFCIGHSYFCRAPDSGNPDDDWYERIVRFEIGPLLREYWFDDEERADAAVEKLLGDA